MILTNAAANANEAVAGTRADIPGKFIMLSNSEVVFLNLKMIEQVSHGLYDLNIGTISEDDHFVEALFFFILLKEG